MGADHHHLVRLQVVEGAQLSTLLLLHTLLLLLVLLPPLPPLPQAAADPVLTMTEGHQAPCPAAYTPH